MAAPVRRYQYIASVWGNALGGKLRMDDEIKLDVNRIRELLINLQELTDLRFSLHTVDAAELIAANRRMVARLGNA